MSRNWLTQLAPGHAPPQPAWWPPAPGWWALAALVLAAAIGFTWWWRRDPYRRRRRSALRELRRIRTRDDDTPELARAIENVLRRFAMAVFGGQRVAGLGGEAWLSFVGTEGGEQLAGESGRALLAAAFGGRAYDDRERWLQGAKAFVRGAARHDPPQAGADHSTGGDGHAGGGHGNDGEGPRPRGNGLGRFRPHKLWPRTFRLKRFRPGKAA